MFILKTNKKYNKFEPLLPFIPEGSSEIIFPLLHDYKIHLKVVGSRQSKYGDFRPPHLGSPSRISINGDLNKYAFLVTLLHEIAHAVIWDNHKQRVQPHGPQWKYIFGELLQKAVEFELFPIELTKVVSNTISSPKASITADVELYKALREYDSDKNEGDWIYLQDLPENSTFFMENGMRCKKLEKRVKNFRCYCLDDKKHYIIRPIALVHQIED